MAPPEFSTSSLYLVKIYESTLGIAHCRTVFHCSMEVRGFHRRMKKMTKMLHSRREITIVFLYFFMRCRNPWGDTMKMTNFAIEEKSANQARTIVVPAKDNFGCATAFRCDAGENDLFDVKWNLYANQNQVPAQFQYVLLLPYHHERCFVFQVGMYENQMGSFVFNS